MFSPKKRWDPRRNKGRTKGERIDHPESKTKEKPQTSQHSKNTTQNPKQKKNLRGLNPEFLPIGNTKYTKKQSFT